jgi:hypothetical protein
MPVPATTAAERATPEPAGTPRRLVPVPEDAAARMDGAVADADSTKPQRAALETPTHDPGHLTERGAQVRVVLGWLAIASGALVAVGGLIAPWDASGARPSDDLVVQVVSFLLLAGAAGVALLSQGSTPAVGVALSYVTASVGALQALGLIGLIRTNMLPETSPGWWLSLVGSSGIVLVALLAIIAPPLRASLVRGHMRWSDPAALVIAAGTAVGVLVFLYLATQASDPFTGYWVAWFTLCSGVTVVLGGMGLTIAPLAAARAWLMATGLTLAERSLALGLLAGHQGQDSPSYTVGIIAGVAVLVGAPLLGRWPHHAADPSTAGPANTP